MYVLSPRLSLITLIIFDADSPSPFLYLYAVESNIRIYRTKYPNVFIIPKISTL